MKTDHALSWQTGPLTFRNQSLSEVKKQLEQQYGTEILMYHELFSRRFAHSTPPVQVPQDLQDEIRVVLYLQYNPDDNGLQVAAWLASN
jgi:ferric-dicitrate binding protein FerR (iron transport regulator)